MSKVDRIFWLVLLTALPALAAHAAEAWTDSLPLWKRFTWRDLSLIMNKGEELQFREIEDRATTIEWERRFWLRRDPTPTTAYNERREVHERRLAHARTRFPADNDLGLDQRGEDYVVFGPPDEATHMDDWFDETGHHPSREIWLWSDLELRAVYSDWNLDGEYELAFNSSPTSRHDANRRIVDAYMQDGRVQDLRYLEDLLIENPEAYEDLFRLLAEGEIINVETVQSAKVMADLFGPKFRRMEGNYIKMHEERRDPYVHRFDAEPLWTVFAVDCYRGEQGNTRVELSHQLRIQDLNCQWDFKEQVFRGEIVRRVVFYDENEDVVSSLLDSLPVRAEQIEDTQSSLLLPGLSIHSLSPGRYKMALRLEDGRGSKMQIYTTPVEVPAFATDSLGISDISFATSLQAGDEPRLFRKGDWILYPHPLRSYSADKLVVIYFEVYGLSTDAQGLNDYSVSYRIRPRNPRTESGWLWTKSEQVSPEVSSTFQDRHGGELARYPLTIPADSFAEGAYILEVEIEDRLSGRRVKSESQFSILPEAALH